MQNAVRIFSSLINTHSKQFFVVKSITMSDETIKTIQTKIPKFSIIYNKTTNFKLQSSLFIVKHKNTITHSI